MPNKFIGIGDDVMEALQSIDPDTPMFPDRPSVVSMVDDALFIVTPEVETLQSMDR